MNVVRVDGKHSWKWNVVEYMHQNLCSVITGFVHLLERSSLRVGGCVLPCCFVGDAKFRQDLVTCEILEQYQTG